MQLEECTLRSEIRENREMSYADMQVFSANADWTPWPVKKC